jgi:hypothetical protein
MANDDKDRQEQLVKLEQQRLMLQFFGGIMKNIPNR